MPIEPKLMEEDDELSKSVKRIRQEVPDSDLKSLAENDLKTRGILEQDSELSKAEWKGAKSSLNDLNSLLRRRDLAQDEKMEALRLATNPEKVSIPQAAGLALLPILTTAIGAGLGGVEGGAAGARAGAQGTATVTGLLSAEADRRQKGYLSRAQLAQDDVERADRQIGNIQEREDKLADIERRAEIAASSNKTKIQIARENADLKRELAKLQTDTTIKAARISAAQKNSDQAAKPTEGRKAVDRDFGKEWSKFRYQGGYSGSLSDIKSLEDSIKRLDPNDTRSSATGVLTKIPGVGEVVTPERAVILNNVRRVVFKTLKERLGGQFTQKEGEALVANTYNPSLSPSENRKNIEDLLREIKIIVAAKESAGSYFEENGTMTGYDGPDPQALISALKEGGSPASEEKPKVVRQNGYEYILNEETGEYE